MKKFFQRFNGNDGLFFGGLIILGIGIGLVSVPGALASVGGILLVVGLMGSLRGNR